MRFSVRSNLVAHGKRRHGRILIPIVWSARKAGPAEHGDPEFEEMENPDQDKLQGEECENHNSIERSDGTLTPPEEENENVSLEDELEPPHLQNLKCTRAELSLLASTHPHTFINLKKRKHVEEKPEDHTGFRKLTLEKQFEMLVQGAERMQKMKLFMKHLAQDTDQTQVNILISCFISFKTIFSFYLSIIFY